VKQKEEGFVFLFGVTSTSEVCKAEYTGCFGGNSKYFRRW